MQHQDLHQLLPHEELVNLSLLGRLQRAWGKPELKLELLHRIGGELYAAIYCSFFALLCVGFILLAIKSPLMLGLTLLPILDLLSTRESHLFIWSLLVLASYGAISILLNPTGAVLIATGAVIAFISLMSVPKLIKDIDDHILFSTVKSRADKYDPSVQEQKIEPVLLLPRAATPTTDLTYSSLFFRSLAEQNSASDIGFGL